MFKRLLRLCCDSKLLKLCERQANEIERLRHEVEAFQRNVAFALDMVDAYNGLEVPLDIATVEDADGNIRIVNAMSMNLDGAVISIQLERLREIFRAERDGLLVITRKENGV